MQKRGVIIFLGAVAVAVWYLCYPARQTAQTEGEVHRPKPLRMESRPTNSSGIGTADLRGVEGTVVRWDGGVVDDDVIVCGCPSNSALRCTEVRSGSFVLDFPLPEVPCTLVVIADGLRPATPTWVERGMLGAVAITLEPQPAPNFRVRAVDSAGGVISGAIVAFEPADPTDLSPSSFCRTGDDGVCALLADRRLGAVLSATAPGYARGVRLVPASGQAGELLDIILRPGGRITGVVMQAQSEVQGAAVRSCTTSGRCRFGELDITDAAGRFVVDGIPPGHYRIHVNADKGVGQSDEFEVWAGAEIDLGEIHLSAAVTLDVAIDVGDRTPCARGVATLDGELNLLEPNKRPISAGRVRFGGVDVGRHHLFVRCDDPPGAQEGVSVAVDVERDTTLEITVPQGTVISGQIMDEYGQPLENAGVGVKRTSVERADTERAPLATTRTDDAGEFIVGLGGDGDHCMIDVRLSGYAPTRVDCGLVQGVQVQPVDITLRRVGTVRGMVSFGQGIGGGASGAEVELFAIAEEPITVEAGLGGGYQLSDVPPGNHQLCARLQERSTCVSIELARGETVERDLDLGCASSHITGQVIDASGDPVEDAELEISTTQSPEVLAWSATMSSGRFELTDLPGCIDLRLTVVRGSNRHSIVVAAGESDVDVELPTTASLDVSLGCEPRASVGGAVQVEVQRPGGVFPLALANLYGTERLTRFTGLPRAKVIVRSRSGGESTQVSVDLEVANHADLPCPD